MSSNLLFEQVTIIQEEYKELLEKLLPMLREGFSFAVLDEIHLFWTKKISLVELFIKAEVVNNNSYIFTGATYMDFKGKDHYPFVLLGKYHLFDDPLARYADLCIRAPETQIANNLFKQIVKGVENNINILEECKDAVFIFPLRILNHASQEYESLVSTGTDYFLSLFDGVHNIDDYYKKCNSITDIVHYLQKNLQPYIRFTEYDNFKLSFSERYNNAIKELADLLDDFQNDAYKFHSMVYGSITQSVDILSLCVTYKCIPMIRYPVAVHYFLLLCNNINNPFLSFELRLKASIARMIYQECNRTLLSSKGFKFFTDKIADYSFETKVMEAIQQNGITEEDFSFKKIATVVKSCLDELYTIFDD